MNILIQIVLGLIFSGVVATEAQGTGTIRVACIGDSTTQGAGVENKAKESYPAQLQILLGDKYEVMNFGVGSCTLIRKGSPNVWRTLKRIQEGKVQPDIVVIDLGINDTCGGSRKCWDHKDEFPGNCRDLIDALRALPSKPRLWLCAPTPMVLETPGLKDSRRKELKERCVRLQELIVVIKEVVKEKKIGFIDLNTPLVNKPELFKDGVHMNKDGYRAVAELVNKELQKGPKR